MAIKDENGQWLYDFEAIKRHVVQFFSKSYTEDNISP